MNSYRFTLPGFLVAGLLLTASCSKNSDIPEFARCVGGQDGQISLELIARHHSKLIPSQQNYPDTAYIKFNTSEFPGDDASLYDLVVAGTYPDTVINISNMSCGNYYIFMTGFDVAIAERVKGGVPVTLNEEDQHRSLNIPVTED